MRGVTTLGYTYRICKECTPPWTVLRMTSKAINSRSNCCFFTCALQESWGQPSWCAQPCVELPKRLLTTCWLSRCPPAHSPVTVPENTPSHQAFWFAPKFVACMESVPVARYSPAEYSKLCLKNQCLDSYYESLRQFFHTWNKCLNNIVASAQQQTHLWLSFSSSWQVPEYTINCYLIENNLAHELRWAVL